MNKANKMAKIFENKIQTYENKIKNLNLFNFGASHTKLDEKFFGSIERRLAGKFCIENEGTLI